MAWLYVPRSGTSASTQAGRDSTPDFDAHAPTLAASAMWRSKRQPLRRWLRAFKRERWMTLLCGAMPERSTASASVDSWLASLEAARAQSSPLPTPTGKKRQRSALRRSEGASSTDSSTSRTSAGRRGFSGRTWGGQHLLFPSFLDGSRNAGGVERGPAFSRVTLEAVTGADESSFWPTATARDWKDDGANVNWLRLASKTRLAGVAVHSCLDGPLAPLMSMHGEKSWLSDHGSRHRSLNPLFVAWLMGWTWWLEGWDGSTFSASLGTESSPTRPQQPFDSSGPTVSVKNEAA